MFKRVTSLIILIIAVFISSGLEAKTKANAERLETLPDSSSLVTINELVNKWLDENLTWEKRYANLDSLTNIYFEKYGRFSLSYALLMHKKGVYQFYSWYEKKDDLQGAIRSYDEAVNIRLQLEEKYNIDLSNEIVKGLYNIADCYLYLMQPTSAIEKLKQALNISDQNSQNIAEYVLLNLHLFCAHAYSQLGDFDNAVQHLVYIVNFKTVDDQKATITRILARNELGNLYAKSLYDPKTALLHLYEARKIIVEKAPELHHLLSDNFHKTGIAYYRMGKSDSAQYYFLKSLEINLDIENSIYAADDYLNIAVTWIDLKETNEAITYLEQAITLYEVYGKTIDFSVVYDNRADIAFLQHEYTKSLEYHNEALACMVKDFVPRTALSTPNIQNKIIPNKFDFLFILNSKNRTLLHLYFLNRKFEFLDAAYAITTISDQVIGMMRSEFQAEASRMSLASYAKPIYEQGIEVCYQLFQLNPQDSLLEKAFELSEKSRAITLLDAVRKTKASARVERKLIEEERSLNLKVNYFEKKAALYEQDSTNRTSYNVYDSLLYFRRHHQAVIEQIRESTPEYYSLIFDQETTSLDDIQNSLENDQCMIEYFLGDSSLYSFVIHKGTVLFRKQDGPEAVRRWVAEWMSAVQSLDHRFILPSFQLYQDLFNPLEEDAPLTTKITIIPDDVLNMVNFESLVTELPPGERIYLPSFNQYLLYEHQFSYAFSATTLYETKQTKKAGKSSYLGIAPEMNEGFYQEDNWFDKLDYNQEEVVQAARLFSKKKVVESNKAKEQFMQLAPSYSLIHCATHAMANNKDGDLSFILFGENPNDMLFAKDLYALDLNANLVVLSACQTSAGELNRGEGIISLGRGFTYAGAASVVTSLWNVREKTNKEIIYEFYRLLKKGKAKDEALRNAKINYLKNINTESQMNAHPYFWAPLVVIGDSEPLKKNYSWKEITAISLLLIFIATLIYYYHTKHPKL